MVRLQRFRRHLGADPGFLRSLVRTPPAFSYSLLSLPYFRPTPDRNEAFANPLASWVNPLEAFANPLPTMANHFVATANQLATMANQIAAIGLAKAITVKAKAAKGFPKAASGQAKAWLADWLNARPLNLVADDVKLPARSFQRGAR